MITRTFITSDALAMVANPETASVETRAYSLAGKFEGKDLEKKLAKAVQADGCVLVKLEQVNYEEQLYGMEEDFFLANAKKLPPRGTKAETEEG